MGGGVLPMSVHNGEPVFLFSREAVARGYRDSGKWSDFGGSKEGTETQRETAIREAAEEASGLLGDRHAVDRLISDQLVGTVTTNGYTTYIIYVPYWGGFPSEFRRIYDDAVRTKPDDVAAKNGLFEKDDARWVSLRELGTRKSGIEFRPWYVRSGIVRQLIKKDWSNLFDQDRDHKLHSK